MYSYKKLNDLFLVPLRVFLIILLCVMAIRFFPSWVYGVTSYLWPKADGVVLEKALSENRIGGKRLIYKPIVRYEYQVHGVTYQSENLDFAFLIFGKQRAQNKIDEYSASQSITVFYNPFNPKLSCLICGTDLAGHLFALLILLTLMRPALLCLFFLRKITPRQDLRYHPAP